jgi:F-type H+-transporting ATPase subunit gamma
MASLKVLRRRIRSVTSTQQITKAMEMVAAAKLRRAQARALAARPYAIKLTEMLGRLAAVARERELAGPAPACGGYLAGAPAAREPKHTALVLVGSDRGLCGSFNAALFRVAEERLQAAEPGSLSLVVVGKKGREHFRRRAWPVLATFTDQGADANVEFARRVAADLLERFQSGAVDRVEILYTRFQSATRRRVTREIFLPIGAEAHGEAPEVPGAGRAVRDVIFEPALEPIFASLLPRFAVARLFAALADSRASEEAARMLAMGAATKNAGELLDLLVLQRNRLRQTMITREILDIVGGAEALR